MSHYLLVYFLLGPVVDATDTPLNQPAIADHVEALVNNMNLLEDMFDNLFLDLDDQLLPSMASLCDMVFQNATLYDQLHNVTDVSQSDLLTHFNMTESISDWLILSDNSIGTLCDGLLQSVNFVIAREKGKTYITLTLMLMSC